MKSLPAAFAVALAALSFTPVAADEHFVDVNPGLTFSPSSLTIQVGDTVTWTNRGGTHNVEADDGSFRCANGCDGDGAGGNGSASAAAWSFSLTFNDPATIRYFCEVHGGPNGVGMSGVLRVEGDDEPDPPDPEFNSGFEEPDFSDWDDRFCPSCNAVSAFLGRKQAVVPAPSYRSREPGLHRAWLEGPDDTDFDLSLERWDGTEWQGIATSDSPDRFESLSVDSGAGRYRWVVRSESGHGNFRLIFRRPKIDQADPNELRQTARAKKKGQLGLESAYVKGSANKDYLIDLIPVAASEYELSFWIRLDADLIVKGKKTILLQLRSRNKDLAHVRLLAPAKGERNFRLQLRARSGGKLRLIGEASVKPDKYLKHSLVWRAASDDGAADGLVRLFRKRKKLLEALDLDNAADRAVELRFGQVSKSKRGTSGIVSVDVLKSKFAE